MVRKVEFDTAQGSAPTISVSVTSSRWPWLWLSGGRRPPQIRLPPTAGRPPPLPGSPPHPYTDVTTSNLPAFFYDQKTSGHPASSSRATHSDQLASSTDENPSGCGAYVAAAGKCRLFDFVTMLSVAVAMTLAIVVSVVVAAVDFSVAVALPVAVVFVVPLKAMGMVVPTAVDVVFGRGCGRSNFRGGCYALEMGPLVAAIT